MNSFFLNLINGAVVFIIIFFETRGFIGEIITYLYNRNAQKKRKKGQNFIEWFTYSKFKDRLPKKFYIGYYSNFVVFLFFVICMIILKAIGLEQFNFVVWIYIGIAQAPASYLWFKMRTLYWDKPNMENIVHKNHGNKK